jgi:transposase-like protein
MKNSRSLFVTEEDRALLLSWLASAALTPAMALRARVVLASAAGEGARAVARELGASVETVYLWRRRFQEHGIDGLRAHALPGRRVRIESRRAHAILRAGRARESRPSMSVAEVARAAGVSRSTVRRLWERHGVRALAGAAAGEDDDVPAGGAPEPASIVGIFTDLPFRALARVISVQAPAGAPAASRSPGRGGARRDPHRGGGASAGLLLTTLEAFGGGGAATTASERRWDEGGLAAVLDALGAETPPAMFEILAGPRATVAGSRGARAARAAGKRERGPVEARSRLIRARTQGEWLTRAGLWLSEAPRDQEPVLAAALGHLMDYFAGWTEESGPFVWTASSFTRRTVRVGNANPLPADSTASMNPSRISWRMS